MPAGHMTTSIFSLPRFAHDIFFAAIGRHIRFRQPRRERLPAKSKNAAKDIDVIERSIIVFIN